jgi:plastocyanin
MLSLNTNLKKYLSGKLNIPILGILLLSVVMAACGDNPTPAPAVQVGNTTAAGQAVQTTAASAVPTTINIDLASFKFAPAEISIPAGTTVIWTNKDAAKHDVVADDNSFESPTLDKGQTYTRKFDTPGTITYYCKFHGSPGQGMIGKLTVTPAQAGAVVANTTAAAAAPSTTQVVAAATTAAQATSAPVTTAAPVATDVPATTAPVATAPASTAAAAEAPGTINFRDDLQLTDQLTVIFTSMAPLPSGYVYFGWLQNSADGSFLKLGQLIPGPNGAVNMKFSDPQKRNLLAIYDKFLVTHEILDPTPGAPSSMVIYTGQLPGPALLHIRHLLVSFPATPGKIGLEVGLRDQTTILRRHTEFMVDALKANDLATVKLHAEHLVNLIEGSKGPDYGDLNKDGQVTNPGDGYGLLKNGDQLGYLGGSKEHANLAAQAEGATPAIKLHAGHVGITVDNATGWVNTVRDRSLALLKVGDIKSAEPLVQEISVLSNQILNGVDVNGDGIILPIPGSGGVLTSYQHAQLMASIPLAFPGNETATAPGTVHDHTATPAPVVLTSPVASSKTPVASGNPTTAAVANPTTAAASGSNALGGPGQEITMDITGFKFAKNPITIKAGTKVTWTNRDSAPHTATADNSSWDSGILQTGQSFSFVFNKPGQVTYHCEVHPNMTATIIVVA